MIIEIEMFRWCARIPIHFMVQLCTHQSNTHHLYLYYNNNNNNNNNNNTTNESEKIDQPIEFK